MDAEGAGGNYQVERMRCWVDFHVAKLRELIFQKRLRLLCARCGKEWRGGHECEEPEQVIRGDV